MADQILIVDDEPNIRHLLQQTLSEEKYKVQTAGSVLEAIEKLHETSFALAIVDLLLPGVNGLELAEAIRIIDPGTPVVLISAYGTPAFEGMASHPAIRHYLHKPFSMDRLLGLVRRYVPSPERNGGGNGSSTYSM